MVNCPKMNWKQSREAIIICIIQHFEPQNPEFRNNPENFQPCKWSMVLRWTENEAESCNNLPNSAFWGWLSTESQLQNAHFRNNPENFQPCKWSMVLRWTENKAEKLICLIQYFEADFLQNVSLKMLNPGIILKTFSHVNPTCICILAS